MKSIISFLIIVLLSLSGFSQKKQKSKHLRYFPLETFKKNYNHTLTKKDSLNFMIRDKDTLVLITENMKSIGTFVDYAYKDSIFLKHYKKVAFNHKNDSLDPTTTMKYWKNDIKLFFAKSVSRKEKKAILKFVKIISNNVDSLNIYEAKNHADSNYQIYYSTDYNYDSNLKNLKGADYWIYWNGDNQIYKGVVKINTEKYFSESLRIAKIKTLLFRSLGHFELSDEFDCRSYFSNCFSENKQITDFDYELLRYHYCYGICKGTSLNTFEIQHEDIKKILNEDHHAIYRFYYSNN
ncbi:hypothetical protein [Psychroserpens mesophilus]|uniref:hypothetical protein n=1 Tax=Psychroserpens mesophilus TaxID=325473 RepID=UPI003D65C063